MSLGDSWAVDEAVAPAETSPLAMDYYRNKAREFQSTLNAIDSAYTAANSALATGAIDAEGEASLIEALDEYEGRRVTLRITAEAINAGAAVVNGLGGRFPQLSLPGALGAVPVAPLALIGAIGTAAGLIVWGTQWVGGVNERLKRAQLIAGASPNQRDQLVRAIADSDSAVSQAQSSVLASIAPAIKWVAIGALAFFAYKAYTARKRP
jgi:hypothetical protein